MSDLSAAEQRMAPEADARVRSQLEDELRQATDTADARKRAVNGQVKPSTVDWIIIEDYADAKARVILARRNLDSCGFGS